MNLNFFTKKTVAAPTKESLPQSKLEERSGDTSIQDVIAPPMLEVDFSHLKIGDKFIRTIFVIGYPRYVSSNWLSPLINFNHSLDVAMYIYPTNSKDVLEELRRRTAEMEAEISTDIQRGKIPQAGTQAALEDVKSLQQQIVKGVERFFQSAIYITISAEEKKELDTITEQIQSLLGSLMIISKPASLSMEEAFKTTLPYCQDKLMITRNMDTTALATTFPFVSSEMSDNKGILYGINAHNASLVIFDRFSLENANLLILSTSGGGKSINYNEQVLIKNAANEIKRVKIGHLVDKIIQKKGSVNIDKKTEGNLNPQIKVYSFDPRTLKGGWSSVVLAARKKSPNTLYKFTTKSGREIITTADHSLVTLHESHIKPIRGKDTKVGDFIPLPQKPISTGSCTSKYSPEYYAILGYYTAEGFADKNCVRISATEPEIINHIIKLCKQLKLKQGLRHCYGKIKEVSINSKVLSRKLKLDKCFGNSAAKKAPGTLFAQSNIHKAAYLKAYFDGDGCVESKSVTAVTKSKDLISDLSYLLYSFGIIARLKPKFKRATGTNHKGDTYYQLSISGQDNLQKFYNNIGFNLGYKQKHLESLLGKKHNSNVNIIPNLQKPLKQIYQYLYLHRRQKAPQRLIELKNGSYNPTPTELKKLIQELKPRIQQLESRQDSLATLALLPSWQEVAAKAASSKKINTLLWKEMGQTWRIMKKGSHPPQIHNVLKVYKTLQGQEITKQEVFTSINHSFKTLGFSLQKFDSTLWHAVTQTNANTSYDRVLKAGGFLLKQYSLILTKLTLVKDIISNLEKLAESNLFWDPIVKIEKQKSTNPYVYDLTVNNQIFLAGHAGVFVHNSFFAKLEIMRSLMFDVETIIIDPENEYEAICKSVGGNYISFSVSSPHKVNPFEIADPAHSSEDEMGYKYLFLNSLLKIMLGELSPTEDAILNRALVLTYRQKGITDDPSTHTLEPPRMEDLYKALIGMEEETAKNLSARLERFVMGSIKGIFDQQSNIDFNSPITVFTLRELADDIRPIVMFMILDYIWTKIRKDLKKRLLVVDEAWYLMRHEDSAKVLQGFVKRARKYYLGVTIISQNADDFLNSPYGKAIVTNSALQILFKQNPAAIDQVTEVFYLSQGERHMLLSANVGEGLFFAGNNHVAINVVASPEEYALASSKPSDVIAQKEKIDQEKMENLSSQAAT